MRKCAPIRHPATHAALTAALLLTSLSARCSASGTLTPVKLRVHGREVALKTPAVYDGKEIYLPLDALGAFKASYVLTKREESALVTPLYGQSVEIALARPGRVSMLPLSSLNKQLRLPVDVHEGICDVDAPREPAQETKTVSAPPPARPKPSVTITQANPASAKPAGGNDSVQAASQVDSRQRASAPGSLSHRNAIPVSTARLSQDDPQTGKQEEAGTTSGAKPQPAVTVKGELDDELMLNLPPSGTREAINPTAKPQYQPPAPAVRIEDVIVDSIDDRNARVRIKTSGRAPEVTHRLLRDPWRLAIDIPRSAVTSEQREWPVEHPLFSALHLVEGDKPGTSRLVVDLSKLNGYSVEEPDATGITINLMVPRGSGKKLQGLRVLVDPGHGGPEQTGTSAVVNGVRVYEKNLTLSISKKVQRLLTESGVDVIMTRTTDAEVGLSARPAMANRNRADIMVSVHIDDCGIPNSASGTTAYYHMDDPSSRALALSIAENIGRVSGLPVRGAWSDRRRFPQSGMAVLRGSRVPATLVEVGYINNSRDRAKIVNPEFQQTIAQAIVDGIKGYIRADLPVGADSDTDTQ